MLSIFFGVSIVVVGRFREPLAQARVSQRDAQLMYEMSIALSGQRTRQAVLHALARNLQQTFYAAVVEVLLETETGPLSASVRLPADVQVAPPPDRIIPIQAAPGLIGEIHIWRGNGWLPPEESRLLLNLAALAATAIERAHTTETESLINHRAAANDR